MMTNYEVEIDNNAIKFNLNRLGNQIYKTLCLREEGKDWQKPLETIMVELLGMANLFPQQEKLCSLACKIQGLTNKEIDFMLYRRTVFECCSLVNKIKDAID